MPTTATAKATKGLEKLVMWKLNADNGTEAPTYGSAVEFVKRLMAASCTPTTEDAVLNADNQVVEEVASISGGDITIDVTALLSSEEQLLYGEKDVNGTNVVNKDDIGAYVAVAYMTNRTDGTVNLYKFPKVRFSPHSESQSTKEKGSTKFDTIQIKGKYIPTCYNGDAMYKRKGVDPVADAAFITSWFTDATFVGTVANSEPAQG